MKAARWVDMGRVVCEEAPVPSVAEGQLLVRTAYASICGSDLHSVFLDAPPEPGPRLPRARERRRSGGVPLPGLRAG